jgi:hypothetical protein
MRVIFDRSAFHGDGFTAIEGSAIRKLVKENRVLIFHTPIFLDETISSYGSSRASDDWKAHLAFAVDVCNGGVCLSKDEIWRNELVRGQGMNARYLFPNKPNKDYDSLPRFLHRLRQVAVSGDLQKEWLDSKAEREEAQEKRNNQQGIFRDVRTTIAEALKTGRVKGNPKDYPFAEFLKSEFVHTGRIFMGIVDSRRSESLADQWAQNPARFPYYSAFIEGVLYSGYYAAIEHNLALDRNAQADFEQLAYLTWADVIVSNDQKFFRSAFQTLWAPRGKRLETSESFAALMDKLA